MNPMNVHTIACDGVRIEGRLRRPGGPVAGAALMLHPHPAFGGHMDVWLLPTIAAHLADAGWASLRINFRGVEGSEGRQTGGRVEHLDAQGALAWLREAVPDVPLAVVGWSFGAMIGLRLGTAVQRWVGIGTPTRHLSAVPLEGALVPPELPADRTVIVGEHDQFFGPDTVDVLDPHRVVVVRGADHFLFDRDHDVAGHVVASLAAPAATGHRAMSEPELHARYVVRITPGDVGERVSVRARRGQDEQGPRYSDTLGVLESWDHGLLRIRRRDGSVAEVPEGVVVAGKTLPPPPEPRRRR